MDLLKLFAKPDPAAALVRLPSGSFTTDADGRIIASTLPRHFPTEDMHEIGGQVLAFFRAAHHAQMPVQELTVHFSSLRVTARDLRGGAIIFLSPQTLNQS